MHGLEDRKLGCGRIGAQLKGVRVQWQRFLTSVLRGAGVGGSPGECAGEGAGRLPFTPQT